MNDGVEDLFGDFTITSIYFMGCERVIAEEEKVNFERFKTTAGLNLLLNPVHIIVAMQVSTTCQVECINGDVFTIEISLEELKTRLERTRIKEWLNKTFNS